MKWNEKKFCCRGPLIVRTNPKEAKSRTDGPPNPSYSNIKLCHGIFSYSIVDFSVCDMS